MKKLISVTKNHINRGEACLCCWCPVALAVKEAFNAGAGMASDGMVAYSPKGATAYISSKTPRSVYRFMRRFDNRLPVKPFRFWFKPI